MLYGDISLICEYSERGSFLMGRTTTEIIAKAFGSDTEGFFYISTRMAPGLLKHQF